ncbi:MAG: S-methyl-5'-thioadenosine phosphorylase [Alphaproteobacteria bacterium MarineAlpha11_Bin1]|nr:MAG: S-methyl-5'-thioadenosine phosphorylase [Alphaproteobacteria bacterium MarineAlpha11_Bin1]|tara:strand:+ start:4338 stop:5225 length:888 start_codon:yes stop_codon:yes gene_type:complete
MTDLGNIPVIGIIGGSGVYEIDGLINKEWRQIPSPFGMPSDEFLFGELDGQQIVFLPRHGRGHRVPPSGVNFRANIDAFKRAGVTEILSISAVGSLREEYSPGHFVLVDQFIDRTFDRKKTFFDEGCVAHISMADPICSRLSRNLANALEDTGIKYALGGVYLVIEGPQFSSRAESHLYRSWGCDVIGMTNMPEAKLAREAEMCYATVGMITDYDCWHEDHDDVAIEGVIKIMHENADKARTLIKAVVPKLSGRDRFCDSGCHTALEHAIVTAPEARDPEAVSKLDAVAGRVLGV